METFQQSIDFIKEHINELCKDIPPWKIIALTAGTTYSLVWLHSVVFDPEISRDFNTSFPYNFTEWVFLTSLCDMCRFC